MIDAPMGPEERKCTILSVLELKRDLNAALGKEVFNVAKTERKPIIKPNRMRDDLSRKTMAVIVKLVFFGHAQPYHPTTHISVKATPPFEVEKCRTCFRILRVS